MGISAGTVWKIIHENFDMRKVSAKSVPRMLTSYLPIATGESDPNTMVALWESIKKKRQGKFTVDILLLHNNVQVHKSRQSQAAIQKCGLQQLNHPPYRVTWFFRIISCPAF
ncbi:hypothetical protein XELAEV_18011135mg [Xenopus laevis]|uniref:Uncharacterized protein n=1 Tax=Xenopus laevis TaxID=8355 RepID=A0A974DVV1_XENLA|nr:hypothetical protein XELAEV_18011135mg [Xenopus laevis]